MAVLTRYKLAEQIFNLIEGGDPQAASSISFNEIIMSVGQVVNKMLKTEYLSRNMPMGEFIPNGTVLGLYENIAVSQYGTGRSKCTLPIKPMFLPREMGVWAVYQSGKPNQQFIPVQIGQTNLLRSQPMINDLLGQVGYEVLGETVVFTKDLTDSGTTTYTVDMRLAILDMDNYDDYTMLPIPPDYEWDIIKEVYAMYSTQPIPDKLVDATTKEEMKVPIRNQQQSN